MLTSYFLETYLFENSKVVNGKRVRGTSIAGRRAPAYLARVFRQILLGTMTEVLEPHGIMPGQWGILAALFREPGVDQRRLSERQSIDTNTASRLIDELEELGLVRRQVSPDDRRAHVLRLTAAGEKKYWRLWPSVIASQDAVLAPLDDAEKKVLLDLLTRVVVGNETHARPGTGRRKPVRKSAAPSLADSNVVRRQSSSTGSRPRASTQRS